MITKQKQLFYFVGDKPFASLAEAQKVDLIAMMSSLDEGESKETVADWMIQHAKEIVDTLTTTPKSRLRARKLHGGKRKPRTKLILTEKEKATA